jgi:hypothetical protein
VRLFAVWKVAGVEVPEDVELEPLVGLYVAGVTVPGGERARGEGLREKLRDCRRDELGSLRPCGLSARAASGLTVRMVLL